MCIYAQLQRTTDIHEPRKKETNCFLNILKLGEFLTLSLNWFQRSVNVYLCILRIYLFYAMLEHGNYTEILYDAYER